MQGFANLHCQSSMHGCESRNYSIECPFDRRPGAAEGAPEADFGTGIASESTGRTALVISDGRQK